MHDFLERIVPNSEQHQIGALNDSERVSEFDTRQQCLGTNSGEIRDSMRSYNRMASTSKCGPQHRSGSPGANDTYI